MICIILVGGYGKGLWPLTKEIVKPLLLIGDKVVLDYIMDRVLELDELEKIIISANLEMTSRGGWRDIGNWKHRL